MRGTGLAPARLAPYAPQAYGSTSSPTRAKLSKAAALDVLKGQLSQRIAVVFDLLDKEVSEIEEQKKKMLQQKFDSDIRLLNQQLIATQNQIKTLEKENLSLKTEKNKAVDQMKDLAVAVVRGKEENTPTQSTPSNP